MVTLLLAIHNHQPVGNLEDVFALAFRRCYAPVLEIFARHPRIRVAFHYSGPLLDWLEAHEPGHLRDLERQVADGHVELLGGGFYEPVLAALPPRDARGQVRMMSTYWQVRTGVQPRGFWLCERIWDPGLPATLAGTGLAYTLVDDSHLRYAGLQDGRFSGYYLTEKGGDTLAIFPIDKRLRYLIPFAPAEQVIEDIAAQPAGTTLTYGDDGEKFGLWPHTYEWVIERGWLDRFLALLEGATDRIRSATPGEHFAAHPPTGRIYLPTASYEEMMEWALPVGASVTYRALRRDLERRGELERYGPFVRGGVWENFLVKYPESNQMHKRMLLVSERLAAAEARGVEGSRLTAARRALYQSQCNCAYWHGLFGGLYVNYLRHANYTHIIRADRLLDEIEGAATTLRSVDYDRDGRDELLATTPDLLAIVKPDAGGALVELDWKPGELNVLDTISRKREAYHDELSGDHEREPGTSGAGVASIHDLPRQVPPEILSSLVVDRHPRHSFIDHLWIADATCERVERAEDVDVLDLAGASYSVDATDVGPGGWSATLLWHGSALGTHLGLRKRYAAPTPDNGLAVVYTLWHEASAPRALWLAVECNLALLAGYAPDRYFDFETADGGARTAVATHTRHLASRGALEGLTAVTLVDEYARVRVRLSSTVPFALWRFPVETVSQSESGYERTYQESALYCHWQVTLDPGVRLETDLTLTVSAM